MRKKLFTLLVLSLITCVQVFAQKQIYIDYGLSPAETYSEFTYDGIKTHGSSRECSSGDQLKSNMLDLSGMVSSMSLERMGGGTDQSKVKVKINWNQCKQGVVTIQVYYNSLISHPKCNFFGCFPHCDWTGYQYMYTYRITRKNVNPAGQLSVPSSSATSINAQGYTVFNLSYEVNASYPSYLTAKKIRYVNGRDPGYTVANITKDPRSIIYRYPPIVYYAKGFGSFTVNTEIQDDCGVWHAGPSKTLTVYPTCYRDYLSLQSISSNAPVAETSPEIAYEVDDNVQYQITTTGFSDLSTNYTWTIDGNTVGSTSDIQFGGASFRLLKDLGSYRIGLAVKQDRAQWCKTPLKTMKIFAGGKDLTIDQLCSIELPSDFNQFGFANINDADISLKHFAGYVKTQRSIVVKPGVTLEDGAELFIEEPLQTPDTDLKINFAEQTTYDEYGRVTGNSRSYFNDNGLTIQTQSKNLSRDVILGSEPLYDAYGRPALSTLPAPIRSGQTASPECAEDPQVGTQLKFEFKPDFVKASNNQNYNYTHFDLATNELNPVPVDNSSEGTLGWYYSSHNGTSTDPKLNEPLTATTQYPYSRTLFQHDGSGDVKGVTKPGDVFKAGTPFPYLATSGPEIVTAEDSYLDAYLTMRENEFGFAKPAVVEGEFYKIVTTDEVLRKSVTYTDKAKKALISLLFDNSDHANILLSQSYQFYDDIGRLLVSVPPNGLNQYTGNNFDVIDKTRYFYNGKGLLEASEEKDGGQAQFVYRKDGKIRFSQNTEQRNATPQRYSYTNYDKLARPVESGECTMTTGGIAFNSVEMNAILESVDVDGGIPAAAGIKSNRSFSYYDEPNSALRTQRYVHGAISYTKKDNLITTWYSYDERGRVEWMIQDILGFGIKTIDYRYGPTGQVQDVVYQRGQPDQFSHFYEYDADGRLFKAYTTRLDLVYDKKGLLTNPGVAYDTKGFLTNPGVLELQATYFYYLHGPLKRVELANKLQGIDYVYTVNGELKAINHADPAKDPGGDGPNGVKADVFGMTLDYFTNDYQGANYNVGNVATFSDNYTDQYSGLIKAQRWHGPVEPGKQVGYAYQYDNKNQFINADWGSVTGNAFTKVPLSPYKENIGNYDTNGKIINSYDDNGNILSLQRNESLHALNVDNQDISIADFTYHYLPLTNKLQTITNSDGSTFRSYNYDVNGQMTQETEGDKSKYIVYDVTGKVTAVYADEQHAQPITDFQYDDRGFRLSKTTYDKDYLPSLRTWYVRDASGNMISTYEEDLKAATPPKPTEMPVYGAGKLGLYKPDYGITFYELTDHLGNVRAVIGDEMQAEYLATMESERHEKELGDDFVDFRSHQSATFNTTPHVFTLNKTQETITDTDQVCMIITQPTNENGFTVNPMGIGKMIWVHPGDVINTNVNARYADFNPDNHDFLEHMAGFLATAFQAHVPIDAPSLFSVVNSPEFAALPVWGKLDDTQPRAFLNYILYDKDFKLVDYDFAQVSGAAQITVDNQDAENLTLNNIKIEKEGFIYIYVSNQSDQNMEVYFDDLYIQHNYSNIVAGGDYYPYGLAIKDRQIDREKYRFGYQGKYAEKDEETGWNHFELREYDPVVGRWLQYDPKGQFYSPYVGMGNNPVSEVDVDGGKPSDVIEMLNGHEVGRIRTDDPYDIVIWNWDNKITGKWTEVGIYDKIWHSGFQLSYEEWNRQYRDYFPLAKGNIEFDYTIESLVFPIPKGLGKAIGSERATKSLFSSAKGFNKTFQTAKAAFRFAKSINRIAKNLNGEEGVTFDKYTGAELPTWTFQVGSNRFVIRRDNIMTHWKGNSHTQLSHFNVSKNGADLGQHFTFLER